MAKKPQEEIDAAAREFMAATELLFDWMNGNDMSADHSDQKPEDYERLCAAMERMQDALGDGPTGLVVHLTPAERAALSASRQGEPSPPSFTKARNRNRNPRNAASGGPRRLRRKTAMSLDGLLTLLLIAPFLILGAREIYWSLKGVPRDSL